MKKWFILFWGMMFLLAGTNGPAAQQSGVITITILFFSTKKAFPMVGRGKR